MLTRLKKPLKKYRHTNPGIRRTPHGPVGPRCAERPIRGRGLKCQKNCFFLPHRDLCPDGVVVEAESGETILDAALRSGIEIEHACEKSCACTTLPLHRA